MAKPCVFHGALLSPCASFSLPPLRFPFSFIVPSWRTGASRHAVSSRSCTTYVALPLCGSVLWHAARSARALFLFFLPPSIFGVAHSAAVPLMRPAPLQLGCCALLTHLHRLCLSRRPSQWCAPLSPYDTGCIFFFILPLALALCQTACVTLLALARPTQCLALPVAVSPYSVPHPHRCFLSRCQGV